MIAPTYRDPDHTYLWCDGCTSLGVRLEPMEIQVHNLDGDVEDQVVGAYLTHVEAREYVAGFGWLTGTEALLGDRRFYRDYCPRCRVHAVVG